MGAKVHLHIVDGPNWERDDEGWEHNSYTVELRYQGRRARFPWRQGVGITQDPTALDVLECLLLDATGYDDARSFEEWAEHYGYDDDSRKAEAIFNAVKDQTEKLARLFGGEAPWFNSDDDAERLSRRYANAS